jgi:hypothetical protein
VTIITVLFVGLIAHVNQPRSLDNTAVLLVAPHHNPQLLIPDTATMVDPDDDFLSKQPRRDEVYDRYEIDVTDWRVRLSGTRGMFCDHPQEVLDTVPRLQHLAPKCSLKQAVIDRQTGGPFAAFFDYRGGRLGVADYLQKQLEFKPKAGGGPTFQCASCRMRYTAELEGNYAYLTLNKGTETHVIRVPANSTIEVSNVPDPNERPNSHFDLYYEIFENCTNDIDVLPSGTDCAQKQNHICNPGTPPYPFADCTNSQWP